MEASSVGAPSWEETRAGQAVVPSLPRKMGLHLGKRWALKAGLPSEARPGLEAEAVPALKEALPVAAAEMALPLKERHCFESAS